MTEPLNPNPAPQAPVSNAPASPMPKKEVPPPANTNYKRNKAIWYFTLFLIVIGLAWILYWFFYLQYHEYTDDAYANGNMVALHSAVPGSVVAYYADDTDLVLEGQLLVQLDPTDYRVVYERELASLASIVLQVRQLFDNVDANKANLASKKIALSKAQYDYNNRLQLVDTKAISNEDYTHSKDDLSLAEQAFKQAEAQLSASVALAGNSSIENHPLIKEQRAKVLEAYYNLIHCDIFAPATGYVAQRSVQVGQWAATNINLLAIIPKDYVWVDANYKETQLQYMRVGQPASVYFDLYGSHVEFKGKVLGIASGSGSVFSIIPPQNATGNWIKIVQRLPVRISLDPEMLKKYPMRLGISAETYVDVTNQDLPMLQQTPPTKPVAKTFVYEINFDSVNELMDQIIKMQLE